MSQVEVRVEKLTAKNFSTWKLVMTSLLKSRGLWEFCAAKIESTDEDKMKNNELAKHCMYSAMDINQIVATGTCATAHDLWTKIVENHEGSDDALKANAMAEFLGFKYRKGEPIVQYCGRFELALGKVETAGKTIEEPTKFWVFRNSLPKDIRHSIDSWTMVRPLGKVGELITHLKFQYHQDKMDNPEDSVALYSGEANRYNQNKGKQKNYGNDHKNARQSNGKQNYNKPGGLTCSYCKDSNHLWKACPKLKSDNARKKKFGKSKSEKDRQSGAFTAQGLDENTPMNSHTFSSNKHAWIVDSGATNHMTPHKEFMAEYSEYPEPRIIRLGNGRPTQAYGEGRIEFKNKEFTGFLDNVRWVPELKENLFSVGSAMSKGCDVRFENDSSEVHFLKDDKVSLIGHRVKKNLFILDLIPLKHQQPLRVMDSMAGVTVEEWHKRFAHNAFGSLNELIRHGAVNGLKIDKSEKTQQTCESCVMGKLCRAPHPSHLRLQASEELAVLHLDTCGPISEESLAGNKYFVLSTEEYSDYKDIEFVASKTEIPNVVKKIINRVEVESKRPVKLIYTDNGSEFCNKTLGNWLDNKGIIQNTSTRYTPEQNGRAERANRTIIEATRALLHDAQLPPKLWAEAAKTAVYCLNRVLSPRNKVKTRYELYFGTKPDVSNLRVFGQRAIVKTPESERKGKFTKKGEVCTFVGYTERHNTYRLYDSATEQVFQSCDVVFPIFSDTNAKQPNNLNDETEGPQKVVISFTQVPDKWSDPVGDTSHSDADVSLTGSLPATNSGQTSDSLDHNSSTLSRASTEINSSTISDTTSSNIESEATTSTPGANTSTSSNDTSVAVPTEDNSFRRITRATRGISEFIKDPRIPKYFWMNNDDDRAEMALFTLDDEPRTLKDAQESNEWGKWKAAMDDEIQALNKNGTWELVDRPRNARAVKCKWVFKVKLNPQGDVERYKARLVAKGYSQIPNVDYKETFAPVASMTTIRILFAIANQHDMEILQFDVKTAFLYGDLNETIYMEYPEGYPNPQNKVCKLVKSLYGLKQAPRQWNLKFDAFLQRFNLQQSVVDKCLYYNRDYTLFLAIYVDDGLVASRNKKLLSELINYLKSNFELKVMECEAYLGFQIVRDREKRQLKLQQAHYVEKILEKFGMTDCKPASTPEEVATTKLTEADPLDESYPFKELVGSLLYLVTCTRPDIAHAVSVASRTAKPTQANWSMLKRILRYLKGTPDVGIHFRWEKFPQLVGFSDADYANDLETRRSTTGYCVFYGRGPIAWRCQRQAIVTLSTTEAEYVSGCELVKELLPLRELMIELKQISDEPTQVFIDNLSTVRISQNEGGQQRTKHIDVREKWLNEQVEHKRIVVKHISGEKQAADILTKPLHKTKFVTNRNMLVSAIALLMMIATASAGTLSSILKPKRELVRANPLEFRPTSIPFFKGDKEFMLRYMYLNPCPHLFNDTLIKEKLTPEIIRELKSDCNNHFKDSVWNKMNLCTYIDTETMFPKPNTTTTEQSNSTETPELVTVDKDVLNKGLLNASALSRNKRAAAALTVAVVALAGLATYATVQSNTNAQNIQTLAETYKIQREVHDHASVVFREILDKLDEIHKWSEDIDKSMTMLKDHAEVQPRVAAIITAYRQIIKEYEDFVIETNKYLKDKKVSPGLRILPQARLWDEPASDWSTLHGCYQTQSQLNFTQMLHFNVPVYDPTIKIMEAVPVPFYNRTDDKNTINNICWMKYTGPEHVLVNTTNGCMSEIIEWATSEKSVRAQSCVSAEDELKDEGNLWTKESCTNEIKPIKKRVRIAEVNGLHRIYCHPYKIHIEEDEPVTCPPYVFELEGRLTFSVAGLEHTGSFHLSLSAYKARDIHMNREIMQHLRATNIRMGITNTSKIETKYSAYLQKLKELPNQLDLKSFSLGGVHKFIRDIYDTIVSSLEWVGIVIGVILLGFILLLISPILELFFMSLGFLKVILRSIRSFGLKLALKKRKPRYWD